MATETYQMTISGVAANEYVENVMHFTTTTAVADDTMGNGTNLLASWETNIRTKWLAILPDQYSLQRITARRVITKPSVTTHRQYDLGAFFGTLGSDTGGDQVCPVIFLIPPMGVATGGKIFLPTVGNAQISNNAYVAGYKTAVNTLMAALTANFGTSGFIWKLAIFSRKLQQARDAMAWTLSPAIGFQGRRRLPL